ncbi:hypothetical protein JCM8208_007262 [Rhodotorula glutinis]
MSARPPLPFGLGRDPQCAPHRCLSPDSPLPAPGSPIHDQVAAALSLLFQTFFSTSLRYLGVSEILDWLESSGTVDAWILTGLEGGRLPDDIANPKNLEFGKEAFRQVIRSALQAENEAWATSLRETGFSSSVSMVYEGLVAQLKPSKTAPLPCLHTLLTPTGLSMLKSAPLKSAFPVCPPRTPPSPAGLLASIRTLIQSGTLRGNVWKSTTTWRAQIRTAFSTYHSHLKDLAEELVSERSFALEFYIFLENISQPIQLLQLIADDFEAEFGPGATRGLLGVGEAGGDNLVSIMDFCAARKPSELLVRVKQRVAEKQERERRSKRLETLRAELKGLDTEIRGLLLEYRNGGTTTTAPEEQGEYGLPVGKAADDRVVDEMHRLQRELEAALDMRDAVKADIEELESKEDDEERRRRRDQAAMERASTAVGVRRDGSIETPAPAPARVAPVRPEGGPSPFPTTDEPAAAPQGFKLGSSKDLLPLSTSPSSSSSANASAPPNPFSTSAPRTISTAAAPGSAKGKARALNPPGKVRARYAPPPPTHRHANGAAPSASSAVNAVTSAASRLAVAGAPTEKRAPSPAPGATIVQVPPPRRKRAAGSAASASPSRTPRTRRAGAGAPSASRLSRRSSPAESPARSVASEREEYERDKGEGQGGEDVHCEVCCPACAAEAQRAAEEEEIEAQACEPDEAEAGGQPTRAASPVLGVDAEEGNGEEEPGAAVRPLALVETTTFVDAAPADGGAGDGSSGTVTAGQKKKRKKKKGASTGTGAALAGDAATTMAAATTLNPPTSLLPGFSPLSRHPPPRCCPPHRCTGVAPDHAGWADLDGLLYETILAGFKYELMGAIPSPLFLLRDKLAKSFILGGGRMTTDSGEPKEMDSFLAIAEERGLWHSAVHPEIQAWSQRVLAISMQKLVDVLRATLGEICICKVSRHTDVLREARHRLGLCEQADRQIPIDLPEMDPQEFMRWCHIQLRAKKLAGPEWEGLNRQYIVQDYLLAFSDAFDAAMDRLMLVDPFVLAEDMMTLLEWQGGVRAFDTALRFGRENIVDEFGTGVELLENEEPGPVEKRPLQAWGRLLELSSEARTKGIAFSRDLAEEEKQRGNDYFAAGEHEKAIVSFTTASIIFPTEGLFSNNCAAARMKIGTPAQYAEAVCDTTLALAQDPNSIKALYRRGTALALLGHWKAAFVDLKYLERIAPDCQPAKEALTWATERYGAVKRAGK